MSTGGTRFQGAFTVLSVAHRLSALSTVPPTVHFHFSLNFFDRKSHPSRLR